MINEKMAKTVMQEIKSMHPDENPCMLAIPVIADFAYALGHIPVQLESSLLNLEE